MIKKAIPSLLAVFYAVSSPAQAGFSLGNLEVFKATTTIGTYHIKRETPAGYSYDEFNPGGLLHARAGKHAKCNAFAGAFSNSMGKQAIIAGAECTVLKTEKLGGLAFDVALGVAFSGYDDYQNSFEKKTGVPVPPIISIIMKSDLLKVTLDGHEMGLDVRFIPPSKHSAAIALAAQYHF